MNELENLVMQKAGLSQDQAQKAVSTVLGFLKDKMPGPLASQIDKFVGGGQAGSQMGGMGGMAEGMMGGMGKEKAA